MTHQVVHVVGNAHLDAVWLWPWQEGYAEVRATFRAALDRMDEDPDVTFACDSVAYYAWIEEHDPAMFERIRLRVAEGRWELAGGWWVEPDLNIPCGESLVRQGLLGQRYLLEHFGRTARVGMNVDPFGHPATLPQLLRGLRLEAYVFFRPLATELSLPAGAFRWTSPDGSSVVAYRLPHEYSSGVGVGDMTAHLAAARAALSGVAGDQMVYFGVGDHGGGPTAEAIASIHRLAAAGSRGEIRFSTPERFFKRIAEAEGESTLPRVHGELQHHAVGCYSALSMVKALNRRAETALLSAERLSVLADTVLGVPYPLEPLRQAWRQLAFNQFHDILAGTAIEPVYEEARDQLGEATAIAGRAANRAVQALAARLDTELGPGVVPVLVVNPVAAPVDAIVAVDIGEVDGPVRVAAADGTPIPSQAEASEALVARRARIVFPVSVPALGYRLVGVVPTSEEPAAPAQAEHQPVTIATDPVSDTITLDNGILRAVVDPLSGWLRALEHRLWDVALEVPARASHAVVLDDAADTWAHGIDRFGPVAGAFTPRDVRVTAAGPVRAVVRIESTFGASVLVEEVVLGMGARALEVWVTLDWHELRRVLKLRATVDLEEPAATFSVPYGHVQRPPEGGEEPGQGWVDVTGTTPSGRPAGLAVLCDAKGAWDVDGSSIGITAARSPAFAWHDPQPLGTDRPVSYQDQGRQRFRYALLPHAGSWREADVPRAAAAFRVPPVTLIEGIHPGDLAPSGSFAAVEPPSVELTALKLAEDASADLIVRIAEVHGEPATAVLDLALGGPRDELRRREALRLRPLEVRTLRISRPPAGTMRDVSLLES